MHHHFSAPWSTNLKIATAAFVALGLYVFATADPVGSGVLIAIYALCAALSVRGYTVTDHQVLIHRLGWATRFDLAGIQDVRYEPGAMAGSIRMFGVGSLFGSVGLFRNATLGVYGAYATDPGRSVVIELADKRIVVTPDRPADFVQVIRQGQSAL